VGARKLTPNEQLVSAVRIALLRYDIHREHQAEARSALDAAMLIQYPGQTIPAPSTPSVPSVSGAGGDK